MAADDRSFFGCRFWQAEEARRVAVQIWERSYKLGLTGPDLEQAFVDAAEDILGQSEGTPYWWRFLAGWAEDGFVTLSTSHTFGAALCCTSCDVTVASEVRVQWAAFEVEVPNGLLCYGGVDYDRIRVFTGTGTGVQGEEDAYVQVFSSTQRISSRVLSSSGPSHATSEPPYEERVFPTIRSFFADEGVGQDDRLLVMVRRLVTGLLLAIQAERFTDRIVRGKHRLGKVRRDPDHRVVCVGAPVRVDVRDAVSAYLNDGDGSKRSPPTVQVLVRGHYKRQVCGLGGAERRIIWVEPYWRGPEDALILTRTMVVAGGGP
jgi:hypothetical protein